MEEIFVGKEAVSPGVEVASGPERDPSLPEELEVTSRVDFEFVLASTSPQRCRLLSLILDNFLPEPVSVEEGDNVLVNARLKAQAAQKQHPESVIIAADTLVVLGGLTLGKPTDLVEARWMLSMLSGERHTVRTGLAVLVGEREEVRVEETVVQFRQFGRSTIDAYLATGEWVDKAGAYAIQGEGGLLVSRLEGDYYNVIGLPMVPLGEVFARLGVVPGF